MIRRIARKRAGAVFNLVAGFTYSQILIAGVEAGLLDLLASGPASLDSIAGHANVSQDAAHCLLRAMTALDLAEEVAPGRWMLGQQGAVVQADKGVQAMIRHHRLLYADLADPLALLKRDRGEATALSAFWTYARPGDASAATADAYSKLMAASQAMIAREVLGAYDFSRHRAVLDVGGGSGAFAAAVAAEHPGIQLAIFDLPDVTAHAVAGDSPAPSRITRHAGDFFRDPLPTGHDCVTLIRILHDHDDSRASQLLAAVRKALPPRGRVVIAEPMDETPGASAVGAYFGLYLWAMGSGRPRRATEIGAMLIEAGFTRWTVRPTSQPLVTRVLVGNV